MSVLVNSLKNHDQGARLSKSTPVSMLFNSCRASCQCFALCHFGLCRQYLGAIRGTAHVCVCFPWADGYFHPGFLWKEARWSVWRQVMPCCWRLGVQNGLCPLFVTQAQLESLQLKDKESGNRGTQWSISPEHKKSVRQCITWRNIMYIGIALRVFKRSFSRAWWSR